jgi:hypothetical protein
MDNDRSAHAQPAEEPASNTNTRMPARRSPPDDPSASAPVLMVPCVVVARQLARDVRTVIDHQRRAGVRLTRIGTRWHMAADAAAAYFRTIMSAA